MNRYEIINNYLYLGYIPPNECPAWLNNEFTISNEFEYSVQGAAQIFDKIFDDLVARYPNKKHIVPLSGGWDSRAILGALLERINKGMIETVTFGVPGQLDYDIGIKVAKWAGVKYNALNLKDIEFTWSMILDSVKESPWTYVPDGFFNGYSRIKFSDEQTIIWSGFLGDPLAGSHLINGCINSIVSDFTKKQKKISNYSLVHFEKNSCDFLSLTTNNYKYAHDDWLDLAIRQSYCIAPIVLPIQCFNKLDKYISREKNGACVIAPFAEETNLKYWLTAPRELRLNQKLYRDMLNYKYKSLFELPSKYSLGLPNKSKFGYNYKRYKYGILRRLQRKAPWLGIRTIAHLNYLDYDTLFRERDDYKETLKIAFDYLKENNITPWLNLDQLLSDHMKKKKDYGDIFCVLIGLAANLIVNFNNRAYIE